MNKRDIKAERLFKNGGVKKIGKDKYEVQGSRRVHTVKKIAGYWICPCEDHQFRFEKCYHIRACILYEIEEKRRTSHGNFFNNKYNTLKLKKRAIEEQINKIINQNKVYMKVNGFKDEELRQKHHRLNNTLSEVEKELKKMSPAPKTVIIG
jgi:seryl-tRNA synthetase